MEEGIDKTPMHSHDDEWVSLKKGKMPRENKFRYGESNPGLLGAL